MDDVMYYLSKFYSLFFIIIYYLTTSFLTFWLSPITYSDQYWKKKIFYFTFTKKISNTKVQTFSIQVKVQH